MIQNIPGLTSDELSQKLDLTKADIRYHVSNLIKTGFIKTAGNRIDGRGRPARIYRADPEKGTTKFNNFTEILLNTINTLKPDDPMKLLAKAFPIPNFEQLSSPTRLRKSMEFLEAYQYQTSWEASRSGPKIMFRNCPYSGILRKHPELCTMDLFLVNRLTGLDLIQTAKIDLETSNPACCVFQSNSN